MERAPDIDLRYGKTSKRESVGSYVPPPKPGSQRAVVTYSITYQPANVTKSQVYYIQHKAGRDGQNASLFTDPGRAPNPDRFIKDAATDKWQFRLSVNPERPHPFLPMRPYIEAFMAQVQRDLGRKLDWLASIHYNTGRPHAHIIIRGKDDRGRDLYIRKGYLQAGLRYRAAQIATRMLGTVRDIERVRQPEQTQKVERQQQTREPGRGIG